MRLSLLASAILLGASVVAISPARAFVSTEACTDGSSDTITCGGQTPGSATPVTEVLSQINITGYTGSQWFSFAWSGGALEIDATNSVQTYSLDLDTSSLEEIASAAFVGSEAPFAASFFSADLPAGTYLVGLQGDTEPNGTIGFSSPVGSAIPEPASLALLGSALTMIGMMRGRRKI